jgi:tetratricopeptide (TPR) repeat protein
MGKRAWTLTATVVCLLATLSTPAFAQTAKLPAAGPVHADADVLLAEGREAVEHGKLEQGIAFFRRSLALDPRSRAALVDLGCALADLERWDEARRAFESALVNRPGDPAALNGLGYVLYRLDRTQDAIDCYRQALTKREDPQYHLNLGLAYLAQQRWGQAADQFELTVETQPGDYWGHNNLAYALQRSGKLTEAAAHYERAIAVGHGDDVTAHLNLGGLLLDAKIFDGALGVYQDALRKRDTSPEAHVGLAIALTHQARLPEAQREARVALLLAPQRAQAHHVLAEIYRKRKLWAEAIAEGNQAVKLNPRAAAHHLSLGLALESAGRDAEAARAYDQFLAIEPEGADAREVRLRARLLRP